MSWDLVVHSSDGTLGSVADVHRKVDASIGGIVWSDQTEGVLQQGGYILPPTELCIASDRRQEVVRSE